MPTPHDPHLPQTPSQNSFPRGRPPPPRHRRPCRLLLPHPHQRPLNPRRQPDPVRPSPPHSPISKNSCPPPVANSTSSVRPAIVPAAAATAMATNPPRTTRRNNNSSSTRGSAPRKSSSTLCAPRPPPILPARAPASTKSMRRWLPSSRQAERGAPASTPREPAPGNCAKNAKS